MFKKINLFLLFLLCFQLNYADEIKWFDKNYDSIVFLNQDTFGVVKGDNIGVIDSKEKSIVRSGKYAQIDMYSNLIYVMKEDYLYNPDEADSMPLTQGIYNLDSKLVIPFKYELLQPENEQMIGFCKNDKWGFINLNGDVVIDNEYDLVEHFTNGKAIVAKESKYGVVNKDNEVVIPFDYDFISNDTSDIYLVKKDGKYGYINEYGDKITDLIYDEANNFYYDRAIVAKKDGFKLKYGIIDENGKELVEPKYNEIFNYNADSFATFGISKSGIKYYGKLDRDGNEIISANYNDISDLTKNYFVVKEGKKYNFKDYRTKDIVKGIYDNAYIFNDSLALVSKDGKWFYLNENLEEAFNQKFDKAFSFENGRAIVVKDKKYYIIDTNGNILSDGYDDLNTIDSNIYVVKQNKKYGIYDVNAKKMIVPIENDEIQISKDFAIIKKEDKYGILDISNKKENKKAVLSSNSLKIDGELVNIDAYSIDDNNYFMLRDLAKEFNNTIKKFNIEYNNVSNAIKINLGKSYKDDLVLIDKQKEADAIYSKIPIFVDDEQKSVKAYNINGNTYYKLRDLAKLLNFTVDFDSEKSEVLIKTK